MPIKDEERWERLAALAGRNLNAEGFAGSVIYPYVFRDVSKYHPA